jgi:Leucine-rich repeat (LRR) protein
MILMNHSTKLLAVFFIALTWLPLLHARAVEILGTKYNRNTPSLDLSGKNLETIPSGVFLLKKLTELNLANNEISEFDERLGHLTELRNLNLNNNLIEAIPDDILRLLALENLQLEGNLISALPEEIGDLKLLKTFTIERNRLSSLPDSMVNLRRLQVLRLGKNKLKFLPDQFGSMQALEQLSAEHNEIQSLPSGFTALPMLNMLNMTDNLLTILPEDIGSMSTLKTIKLGLNPMGEIPASLKEIRKLRLFLSAESSAPKDWLNWIKVFAGAPSDAELYVVSGSDSFDILEKLSEENEELEPALINGVANENHESFKAMNKILGDIIYKKITDKAPKKGSALRKPGAKNRNNKGKLRG